MSGLPWKCNNSLKFIKMLKYFLSWQMMWCNCFKWHILVLVLVPLVLYFFSMYTTFNDVAELVLVPLKVDEINQECGSQQQCLLENVQLGRELNPEVVHTAKHFPNTSPMFNNSSYFLSTSIHNRKMNIHTTGTVTTFSIDCKH